jgi:peroxiredoxin
MYKTWYQIIALLLLFVACCAGASAAVEMDQPAPPLKGTLVSGDEFDLANYKGKVVLVNFYSSYCRHCALEIGSIETYYEEKKSKGFEVIMIGIDKLEDKARVARMLGIYNLQGGMTDELTECGFDRSYPTPTAFIIDREGILRAKHWGPKTLPRIRELLNPYVEK